MSERSASMQRALVAALGTRWWVTALSQEDDPISLEPLRKLRYPPFECRADPTLRHRTSSDWFDGRVLAHYLVATANFVHPISRRELSRVECVALDEYCQEHRLGSAHVADVFDGAQSGEASVAQLRAQAEDLLQSLFAGDGSAQRGRQPERETGAAVSDGGLTVVDDDLLPGHATSAASRATAQEAEAFPALPPPRESVESEAGVGAAAAAAGVAAAAPIARGWVPSAAAGAQHAGGQHLLPPPPPPSTAAADAAAAERDRKARARLAEERRAWAAAAAAREAREEAAMARRAEAEAIAALRTARSLARSLSLSPALALPLTFIPRTQPGDRLCRGAGTVARVGGALCSSNPSPNSST